MLTIKEVLSTKDFKAFVHFPFQLYQGNPFWVPPIIKEELDTFDRTKNPAFQSAEARFFLAYHEAKVVGRIAVMLNHIEIEEQGIKKVRFGWFDFVDDLTVSAALLDKVVTIGQEKGMVFMEGPVGFSNLDKVGVLTEGFDHIGTMITWYNHPYYPKHYEAFGLTKAKGYLENKFKAAAADPKLFSKANDIIKKRFQLQALNFTKSQEIMPWVDQMFDLFNESYAKLSSFVKVTDIQKAYFKEKYISFINPEYIKFVVDHRNKLVAFAIVMPSFSEALQKAKGKLFPFGVFHLLRAKKHSKDVIFYLIGIRPDFQNKGVTAIIFNEYYHTFKKRGIVNCIRTPELEENTAIRQMWKHFNPVTHKKRQTYKKSL
ncbi:MAG: GTP cyclohydrolase [Bacteroidota bacterium]